MISDYRFSDAVVKAIGYDEESLDEQQAGAFSWIALIFLAGLVSGGLANILFPLHLFSPGWLQLTGPVLLALGTVLFAWARTAFRRRRTALMPWTPSTSLVSDGPYSHSRNPIYLAFALIYLGVALVLDSGYVLVVLVVVVVLFDRLQIPREESYLEEKFGDEFRKYRARVRRWL
jgi:protein-S-isoprenylcysteine O-methyltransferase Ste14